jgi:hypothetical protein
MSFSRKFLFLLLLKTILSSFCLVALVDGKLGRIDASASLSSTYDSRIFGVSSNSYSSVRAQQGANSKLKSEDDFILTFSPALHYSKKVKWFDFGASAGVEIAQFVKNSDQSYTRPTSSFTIDFDDTLSKNKRISNNAKIRFDATFDVGQSVGASIIEQDLTSYTYFNSGVNVRYNHSPKFGIGGGTSYNYKYYQSSGGLGKDGAVFSDIETLPLSAQVFYIYSEKLDFYSNYTYQRTKDDRDGSADSLIDGNSHSISFGAQGVYSSKLSGNANIGYSVQNFDNSSTDSQSNLITSVGINWKLNSKTKFGFDLSRAFSPSAAGFSMFSTTSRFSVNHRFTEDLSGSAYLSVSNSEFTSLDRPTESLTNYGFGFNVSRQISRILSASGGYDFSYIDRASETYGRHVVNASLMGRF